MQAPAYGTLRDGKSAGAVVRSGDWVLFVGQTHEVAVVVPLRLDELKLTGEIRSHPEEHDPPIHAVVFHHALGQHGTVDKATPHNAVDVHVRDRVFEGVSRVGAPDVSPDRALQALRVLLVVSEVVVALRISP